ncbi:MAG: dihydroneopterin aldolase [Pseudorhodoplanes sp.]
MTDSIFITGLALHAYHGVMPHEGKVGQSFKLDIQLDIDLTEASRSDRLANTVSYGQVAVIASEAFCAQRYRLIEAAAGAVIDALLRKFPPVTRVCITIHKPHAPIAATFDDVGVVITRTRGK